MGLTRKAIEYYEDKGLITPTKMENGYRDYDDNMVERLEAIGRYRILRLSLYEIKKVIDGSPEVLSSILRNREIRLSIDQRKEEVLEKILRGTSMDEIQKERKVNKPFTFNLKTKRKKRKSHGLQRFILLVDLTISDYEI